MDRDGLKRLLEQVKSGALPLEAAVTHLQKLPFKNLGYARIDTHRAIRKGVPEVIYCEGKSIAQIQGIVKKIQGIHHNILATRANPKVAEAIREVADRTRYHERARVVVINPRKLEPLGCIAVVTGGTADLPVAEEAAVTAEVLGNRVERLYDVGVAGLHRLLDELDVLISARVIVVVAGMEGALASVVGGIVTAPVIAVPTSIGYGAHFHGLAPLLAMLNSCAPGVSVVNIDNGFGAGFQAALINRLGCHPAAREKSPQ